MCRRSAATHDQAMFTTFLLDLANVLAPAAVALATLVVIGIAVAAYAATPPAGYDRPTVS
jgi:hypothetical protein